MSGDKKSNHLILKCPLCEERALHSMGTDKNEVRQCISCGYVSAENFKLKNNQKIEEHPEYVKLTDDMKKWCKSTGDRLWIPIIMTLPFAMLFPANVINENNKKEVMVWKIAYMIDIPKHEQENYPVPGHDDAFYNKKYDTDNANEYISFLRAMAELNEISKTIGKVKKDMENNDIQP